MTYFERVMAALGRIRDHVAALVNSPEIDRLNAELESSVMEREQIASAVETLAEELVPAPVEEAPQEEAMTEESQEQQDLT